MSQISWHPGERISLAHGNGGRRMRLLIEQVFERHLGNKYLDTGSDAAVLPLISHGTLTVTTDGFTVDPLVFPGGNIGSLAVHGTVNDLAVAGADPLYLTLSCFLEEGMEIALLNALVSSIAAAAEKCGVFVVAGDTKVVRKGEAGGAYFATTGIGVRNPALELGLACIKAGDRILVSGPVGDHGAAILLARGEFGLGGTLESDCASVLPITRALRQLSGLRFMRDPTRGGLATVAHELARGLKRSIRLFEERIPVRDQVRGICDILGYDPLYLACEGRVVAVISPDDAARALSVMRSIEGSAEATEIGVVEGDSPYVVLETLLGGERVLEELETDPLPRIC